MEKEKEEVVEEKEEKLDVAALKAEFAEERKRLMKLTTEAQQDAAESTRFLKTILPRINKLEESRTETSFESEWEKNPEEAVSSIADKKTSKVLEDNREIKHRLARVAMMQKHADFLQYEPKIAEISMKDQISAEWSWTEDGLEKLYRLAKFDDYEKLLKKQGTDEIVDEEKKRAQVETSTGSDGKSAKKSLSPQEKRMAKALGLSESDWLKYNQRENAEG